MAAELGAWLRQQREARGWPRAEMARRLVRAGHDAGDTAMPSASSMLHNIHRWEREGGISERHKLHYCRVLGILPSQFGPGNRERQPVTAAEPPAQAPEIPGSSPAVSPQHLAALDDLASPGLPAPAIVAYRGTQEPNLGDSMVMREVLMAAHEGSNHAEQAEDHGIGEATLEQLRADLVRLSHLSDTGAPLSAFLDMRRVRDRIYRLLDRRLWPGEQADLYFLLGCINELMGLAANRLGYPDAAEELIRAGWAYANAIDHNPLRGMLRARLSYVMYWRGWYSQSRDLAADGLRYASQGLVGANLHLEHARALARLGDPDAARRAVGLAHAAREADYSDDLIEIGGEEFALSRAAACSMAGGALAEVADGREAAGELETAVSLYDAGPGPGEQHGVAGKALAGADLAVVRVRSGALDGAVAALEPVLILPPAQRVATLTARLTRVRNELAAPVFRGSPQARDLGDQIEEFGREAVTAGLHSLSGLS
jgi:tetratricopeptide (TPR) repeat protein